MICNIAIISTFSFLIFYRFNLKWPTYFYVNKWAVFCVWYFFIVLNEWWTWRSDSSDVSLPNFLKLVDRCASSRSTITKNVTELKFARYGTLGHHYNLFFLLLGLLLSYILWAYIYLVHRVSQIIMLCLLMLFFFIVGFLCCIVFLFFYIVTIKYSYSSWIIIPLYCS